MTLLKLFFIAIFLQIFSASLYAATPSFYLMADAVKASGKSPRAGHLKNPWKIVLWDGLEGTIPNYVGFKFNIGNAKDGAVDLVSTKQGAVLVFTPVGMKPVRVQIGKSTTIQPVIAKIPDGEKSFHEVQLLPFELDAGVSIVSKKQRPFESSTGKPSSKMVEEMTLDISNNYKAACAAIIAASATPSP